VKVDENSYSTAAAAAERTAAAAAASAESGGMNEVLLHMGKFLWKTSSINLWVVNHRYFFSMF